MSEYVLLRLRQNIVGTAKYFKNGSSQPARALHGIELDTFARDGEDLVVVYQVQIFSEYENIRYPYKYSGPEDPPQFLADLNSQVKHFKALLAWDNKNLVPHASGCDLGQSPKKVSAKSLHLVVNRCNREHGRGVNIVHEINNMDETASSSTKHVMFMTDDTSHQQKPFARCRKRARLSNQDYAEPRTINRYKTLLNKPINVEIGSGVSRNREDPVDHIVIGKGQSVQFRNEESNDFLDEAGHGSRYDESQSDGSDSESDDSDDSVEVQHCRKVLPVPKKRAYVYHTRKRGPPKGKSNLRKRRKCMSERVDNPFLRTGIQCCRSLKCFEHIDPVFAFKMYKDVMMMVREDYKAFLISLYRSEDQCFVIQGRRVCARFLQKGFGFSNDLQSSVKNTPGAVAGPTALALPRDVNRITKKDHIINFLRNYAERYGDMMPNAWFVNLPDIVRKEVYEKFKQDFRSHHRDQAPPTSATFYSVWKSHCNTIRTRRNHGFAKWETCIFLKAEVANNRNNASRERTARDSLRQHLELIKEERRGYHNRCERAMRYPRKYMSIVVDGADQKVFGIPHFREKSKSDRGHKMKVKCVGVLEHRSDKKLWLYAMTEEFLTGANHIIEVVHRTLEERKKEIRKLPEILYVQVDNCTRENKNRYFMSYHEMLVALGVFVEVEVSFLPIVHTHTDIDQAFSALSKVMKRSDARTMLRLCLFLTNATVGKRHQFGWKRLRITPGFVRRNVV